MLSHDDMEQIHHIARLAVLAMCARGVASSEFEQSPEILEVRFTLRRPDGVEQIPVDIEYIGAHAFPIGGMAL